ncbi:hypothetical protein Hanom_Chr01g00008811 [Helianthus anomalus]
MLCDRLWVLCDWFVLCVRVSSKHVFHTFTYFINHKVHIITYQYIIHIIIQVHKVTYRVHSSPQSRSEIRVVTLSPTKKKFRPEIWYALTEEAR